MQGGDEDLGIIRIDNLSLHTHTQTHNTHPDLHQEKVADLAVAPDL